MHQGGGAPTGGGFAEAYPRDTASKKVAASSLHNPTRGRFERAAVSYLRPKGKNHCRMRKALETG